MDPTSRPLLGRRDALRLFALAPAAAAAVTGCATGSAEPDPLEALVKSAKSDVKLAQAIAKKHAKTDTTELIVSIRSDHARELKLEIDRVDPPDPDEPAGPSPSGPDAPTTPDAATEALRTAMEKAQAEAAELTPTLPSHRAGMVGSISAGCASLLEVLG
ncbi:hypothetical protein [Parasphingorhabdus pacifica]